MTVKRGFSKGDAICGKGSSKLNFPSQSIDRRTNSAYRSSQPRTGHLDENGNIVWNDGSTTKRKEATANE